MLVEEKPKRRGRGPGKRPALMCTSLRVNREVIEYFNKYHPDDKQRRMREVLTEYVNKQLSQLQGAQDGTQETVNE